jgi:hypothetical protein
MDTTGSQKEISEVLALKYEQERNKRLRKEGINQYVDVRSESLKALGKDPWVDYNDPRVKCPPLKDGDHVKVLIAGAGINGVVYAGRLIESGINNKDIVCVDVAGGFGDTWYVILGDFQHRQTLTNTPGTTIATQGPCAMLRVTATSHFLKKPAIGLGTSTRTGMRSEARLSEVLTTSESKDNCVHVSIQKFGTKTKSSGSSP